MTEWYPIMLKLEGQRCLVIGGGEVAERKVKGLLLVKANIVVISPEATPTLKQWASDNRISLIMREAQSDDLEDAVLVFAATNRQDINQWIVETASRRNILVNAADEGEKGTFMNPAVIRRGGLVLTASSSGAGPALAAKIVGELSEQFGPEYETYMNTLRKIRNIVKSEVKDPWERRILLQAAVTDSALEEWISASWLQDQDKLINRLRQRAEEMRGK